MEAAEEARLRGNEAFGRCDWDGAICAYTKGILSRSNSSLSPDRRLFSNRSAAYIAKYKAVSRSGVVIDRLAALAVADARTAASIAPEWPKAWYRLYTAYIESGCPEVAVDILREGLAQCPSDPDLLRALAAHTQQRFQERDCPGDSERLIANEKFKAADWDAAIVHYTAAIDAAVEVGGRPDRRAFSNRSAAYLKKALEAPSDELFQKALKLALHDSEMCINLDPSWPKAWYRKGNVLLEDGRPAKAKQVFLDGLGHCPGDGDLLGGLKQAEYVLENEGPETDWEDEDEKDDKKKADPPVGADFDGGDDKGLNKVSSGKQESTGNPSLTTGVYSMNGRKRVNAKQTKPPIWQDPVFESRQSDRRLPSSPPPQRFVRVPSSPSPSASPTPKSNEDPIALRDLEDQVLRRTDGTAGRAFSSPDMTADPRYVGRRGPVGQHTSYNNQDTLHPRSTAPASPPKSRPFRNYRASRRIPRDMSRGFSRTEKKAHKLDRQAEMAAEKASELAAEVAMGRRSPKSVKKAEKAAEKAAAKAARAAAKRDRRRGIVHGARTPFETSESRRAEREAAREFPPRPPKSSSKSSRVASRTTSEHESLRTSRRNSFRNPSRPQPNGIPAPSASGSGPSKAHRQNSNASGRSRGPTGSQGEGTTLAAPSQIVSTALYDVLGVQPDANEAVIKRAYYLLARKYHPDKNSGDPEATEKFQRLGEAYQILSNPETRALYDKYGESAIQQNQVDTVDPSTLFAMVFGSDQFMHLVGELQLATLAAHVDDDGNAPTHEFLENCQNQRVVKLAAEMLSFLEPWTSGDRRAFVKWAKKQVSTLGETNFGPAILYTIGYVYARRANIALGKSHMFGLPAFFKGGLYRTHKINSQLKANAAASRVMNQHKKLVDKVMKLNREGREMDNDESQKIAVEMAENAVDMMWKISVIDIQRTVESVIDCVLSGRDLTYESTIAMAQSENSSTATAENESVEEDGTGKLRKKRSMFGKRNSYRERSSYREQVPVVENGDRRGRIRHSKRSSGEHSAVANMDRTIRERAAGLKELGKIFMSVKNDGRQTDIPNSSTSFEGRTG